MQKEHPVVAPSSDEDPHAQHSDSDYSLSTDDSPHSVDSYQLSTEDDDDGQGGGDEEDQEEEDEHSSNSHSSQLHKAQTFPASSSTSTRDLDGEVDDFFMVELERRSPSPRLIQDSQHHTQESEPQHQQAHEQQDTDAHLALSLSSELVLPTMTPPQSPHASLPVSSSVGIPDQEREGEEGLNAQYNNDAETFILQAKERPRTVQHLPSQQDNDDGSSDDKTLSSPPTTPITPKTFSFVNTANNNTNEATTAIATTPTAVSAYVERGEGKKEHQKEGGIGRGGRPPALQTDALSAAESAASAATMHASAATISPGDNNKKEDKGPERSSPVPSNQSHRPRSSSLVSGASRSPRTPKSVAFAPDVKDKPHDTTAAASDDDAGSSDTSTDDEEKALLPQEYQILLTGTARNPQDIAKTCTKIRTDLRRMSRQAVVHFTTRFDQHVDKSEYSEFDLCVYFIQALGAQPHDAELLLDTVQHTATLVIISSHSTAPLSRQMAIDTRRHLGIYLNKAMPRLPLFRNPFRASRLSQDYESDAELILRNAVSMKELPRINIALLLDAVQRDPTRARITSSWDWQVRLPAIKSLLVGLLFFVCIPYLSYIGFGRLTRPKPPAHALLSNLSYDIKHGFATCSLDLKTASGRPYRPTAKEHYQFTIRVLSTDNNRVTVGDSDASHYRSRDTIHHTIPGDHKQVVLINIRDMGLDACHGTMSSLHLHIWFQNGTRVPGTPVKLVLPEEQKNCPTPPPVADFDREESPTVWEKMQRAVTSSVPFTQSSTPSEGIHKKDKAEHNREQVRHQQETQQQPQKQSRERPQKKPQQQQRQQQQNQHQYRHQYQHQRQDRAGKGEGKEYDDDWAARWGRFSSALNKQFQNAGMLPKYVHLAVHDMLSAFQDMYQFCRSASYSLWYMLEDAMDDAQMYFSDLWDLCDDSYPFLKQVRRQSHRYKKVVRQHVRCYYDQVSSKIDHQLRHNLQKHIQSAKKTLKQGVPMGRQFAGLVDQAIFEADLRVQTLMKARSLEDALARWEKLQLFEQRLRAVERQLREADAAFMKMDRRARRQHATQVLALKGYWVPDNQADSNQPNFFKHGKEQWRSFKRHFNI